MEVGSIVVLGTGRVGLQVLNEGGDSIELEWLEFDQVAVTASGMVLAQNRDGPLRAFQPHQVELTSVEFSPFSFRPPPPSEVNCPTCYDDSKRVASMMPPRCPRCGRDPTT